MAYYSNKKLILVVMALSATILTQIIYHPAKAIEEEGPEIPEAKCIYGDHEYYMTPYTISTKGQNSKLIEFPELPDDYQPQMLMEEGKTVTMEFDQEPNQIESFLVDYEADDTTVYPLKKVDENTFQITQTGIKTLEVHATFPDNQQISYTLLVDVKDN